MNKNTILTLLAALFLLLSAACSAPAQAFAEEAPSVSPREVVQKFYDDYRARGSSLLAEDAYKSHPALTGDAVRQVDEIVATFDKGSYDPFICAQDWPETITAGEAEISGEEAAVLVDNSWSGQVKVSLQLSSGEWKISAFECMK